MPGPTLLGNLEGVGYYKPPRNAPLKELQFAIKVLPWPDPSQPAKCHVRILETESKLELLDIDILGVDPLQALELSVQVVCSQIALV